MLRRGISFNRNVQKTNRFTLQTAEECCRRVGQNRLVSSSANHLAQQPPASDSTTQPSTSSSSLSRFNVYTPPSTKGKRVKVSKKGRSVHKSKPSFQAIAVFKEKVDLRDADGALIAWKELAQQDRIDELNNDVRVAFIRLIAQGKGEDCHSALKIVFQNLSETNQWRNAIYAFGALVNQGFFEELWGMVEELFNVRKAGERGTTNIPPEACEGLIICACVVAANLPGSPLERIVKLVRPLEPVWSKYRSLTKDGAERMHGSPLSSQQNLKRFAAFSKENEKIVQISHLIYQHAILAWGIDYIDETGQSNSSLLSRRINNTCNSNYFLPIQQMLQVLPQAQSEWLRMSFNAGTSASWTSHTWAALIQGLLSHRQTELVGHAWKMYNELRPKGEAVHLSVWNGLLQGYSAAGQWDQACTVWQQMLDSKAEPDQYLYTTMIAMYFRAHSPDEALLTFEELKQRVKERNETITIAAVNAVILGHCFSNRIGDAASIVNEMVQGTNPILPSPNITTMNTMLRAYGRHDMMEGIIQVLRMVGELNLEPDAHTFTTVLDAFTRMGHGEFMEDVFDLMIKEGVRPNEVTFSAIIKNALHTHDENNLIRFDVALAALYRMENKGPQATEVTYTNTISGLLKNAKDLGEFIKQERLPKGYEWKDVEKAGIASDEMLEMLKRVRPEVAMALLLYERLKMNKLLPNRKTFNTLLDGILRRTQSEEDSKGHTIVDLWCIQTVKRLIDEMTNVYSIDIKGRTEFAIIDGLRTLARSKDHNVREEAGRCIMAIRDTIELNDEDEKKMENIILTNKTQEEQIKEKS